MCKHAYTTINTLQRCTSIVNLVQHLPLSLQERNRPKKLIHKYIILSNRLVFEWIIYINPFSTNGRRTSRLSFADYQRPDKEHRASEKAFPLALWSRLTPR